MDGLTIAIEGINSCPVLNKYLDAVQRAPVGSMVKGGGPIRISLVYIIASLGIESNNKNGLGGV